MLRVTARDGRTVAGIKFVVEEAEGPTPEIGYVTGGEGDVRLGLPPGKVALRFFPPNRASRLVSLAIADVANRTYNVVIDDIE